MSTLEAIAIGLLQGLTEFLPVSSSGHLALANAWLGIDAESAVILVVAVHVATLAAVVLVLHRAAARLVAGTFRLLVGPRDHPDARLALAVGVGTLPAVVVALLAKDALAAAFGSPVAVGALLIVNAGILLAIRGAPEADGAGIGARRGLLVGVAQAFAILPGISRSGATIVAARRLQVAPAEAFDFSFLLAIPAILGGAVLELPALAAEDVRPGLGVACLVAGAAAFASGVAALVLLRRLVARGRLALFAPWCAVVGVAAIVWSTTR